uniref:Uncharacterized protein LOC104230496 n=1 Tax=Nicotiana sylvestris TaxID=4096 RepID=A0A1U7X425_NICSY|nr:PREDICTED: uncharacterized protein LOC104230496 [Nicotiana sylvestris]
MPRAEPNKTHNRRSTRRLLRCPYRQSSPRQMPHSSGLLTDPNSLERNTIEFFEKWHIKRILSRPYHPASNGQVKSSNKTILTILKKKLEDAKGLWLELPPEVLWAYRTMAKTSTGETPYSLFYGTGAMILVEIGEPSFRYSNESGPSNDENRKQDLDEAE